MIGLLSQKSNKPTKTKKAMKTKKFLSMAALALVGAMMTGCSSDDDILQPENKTNVVTLTATVGFDDGVAATRAVTGTGVKTFGVGDQMAVIYKQDFNNRQDLADSFKRNKERKKLKKELSQDEHSEDSDTHES